MMERFKRFLEEGRPKPEYVEYSRHPSREILEAYVYEQLDERMLSRVSAHVTTCQSCYGEVQQLRGELEALESQLVASLPDPFEGRAERVREKQEQKEKLSFLQWVRAFAGQLWKGPAPVQRRAFYRHLGAYAAVGALLFVINTILNRLITPPPSPLGSPVEVTKWWNYSYWLLLPWGFLLLWHAIRAFSRGEGEGKKKRGGI
jgi:hypothetical protein